MAEKQEAGVKTIKRIIAVVLLVVVGIVVGYLCYTGSRLTATQESEAASEVIYEQAQSI